MDYKKLYEQTLAENKWIKDLMTSASETMKEACSDRYEVQQENKKLKEENEQLKKKNKEQQLIIDCHLAELEFTEASALDVAMEFNDWLKSKYCEDEEKYKEMYDCFNLYEYLEDEEDEDQ